MTQPQLLLLTPDDWRRIPLADDGALARAVEALVARRFRGVDDQPLLRRSATTALLERAREARARGGVEMYLADELAGALPLALSLVVSLLPGGADHLAATGRAMGEPGVEVAFVELPAGRALRRRRVARPARLSEVGAPEDLESVLVDYVLPTPGGDAVLLSFSSPLAEVADALAELFEAVAASARWAP